MGASRTLTHFFRFTSSCLFVWDLQSWKTSQKTRRAFDSMAMLRIHIEERGSHDKYSSICSPLSSPYALKRPQEMVTYAPNASQRQISKQYERRMASSGTLRRVALVKSDVSEELSASIIRVTRIGEPGTTLVVTSNILFLVHRFLSP
jgi:hypothetical protein